MAHKPAALIEYICDKLLLCWSPEQISGRLRIDYPQDEGMRVGFSSIYRWLAQGLLPRTELLKHHLRRLKQPYVGGKGKRGVRKEARNIKDRHEDARKRTSLGHWEIDTVLMGKSSVPRLLCAVDRKSRYCCLVLLENTTKHDVMRAFTEIFGSGELPLVTATSDLGPEFKCHREFESAFNALYYYTNPAPPWQKPTVENTNGLIRQFFPKDPDSSNLSVHAIASVMDALNNRPRKTLGCCSPYEILHPLLLFA